MILVVRNRGLAKTGPWVRRNRAGFGEGVLKGIVKDAARAGKEIIEAVHGELNTSLESDRPGVSRALSVAAEWDALVLLSNASVPGSLDLALFVLILLAPVRSHYTLHFNPRFNNTTS